VTKVVNAFIKFDVIKDLCL